MSARRHRRSSLSGSEPCRLAGTRPGCRSGSANRFGTSFIAAARRRARDFCAATAAHRSVLRPISRFARVPKLRSCPRRATPRRPALHGRTAGRHRVRPAEAVPPTAHRDAPAGRPNGSYFVPCRGAKPSGALRSRWRLMSTGSAILSGISVSPTPASFGEKPSQDRVAPCRDRITRPSCGKRRCALSEPSACIYQHVPDEQARERSIAEGLGIDLADIKQGFIDEAIAPFAFGSTLAGALLAVELARQVAGNADTNYLQVDPWRSLQLHARRYRPRVVDCEFCSRAEAGTGIRNMWG